MTQRWKSTTDQFQATKAAFNGKTSMTTHPPPQPPTHTHSSTFVSEKDSWKKKDRSSNSFQEANWGA